MGPTLYNPASAKSWPAGAMGSDQAGFEAVLYPNLSLGRSGFIAVMAGVSSASVLMSGAFILAGAWPVAGFFGLDVLLLYLAFRTVRRRAQQREFIRLDASGLHVRRVDHAGAARDWRFEPYWVNVRMDDPPRRDSPLVLTVHGTRLCIGSFLTLEERVSLAQALRHALRRYR